MEFSLRYTPVTGRLHTRYAPVRRSSAEYCYSLLPLDLHVLSLPLAFILSQDQTLHCKNCSFTFLTRLRVSHISLYVCRHTLSLSSHPFQTTFAFYLVFNNFFNKPFFVESGCKNTTIFETTKIFFQKKTLFMQSCYFTVLCIKKKNWIHLGNSPQNTPNRDKKKETRKQKVQKCDFQHKSILSNCTTSIYK